MNSMPILPMAELSALGLVSGGQLKLGYEDASALLAGRRTSLIKLENLKGEHFTINSLHAKLSLSLDGLKIHPVNVLPQASQELDFFENQKLMDGEPNLLKQVFMDHQHPITLVFEYDAQTREFISYDPFDVKVPYAINDEPLSEKQKGEFRHGVPIELSDGTRIQHKATEPLGLLADRPALIVSVMNGGSSSHLLLTGISPLDMNNEQLSPLTHGFGEALELMGESIDAGQLPNLPVMEFEEFYLEYKQSLRENLSR